MSPERTAKREELLLQMKEVLNKLKELDNDIDESEKDIDEIKEDIKEISEDMEETEKGVGEIKEDLKVIHKRQKSMLKRIGARILPDKFQFHDLAQQIVGAMILSVPLAVTEEVWLLTKELDMIRVIVIIGLTLLFDVLLIYYTKYQVVGKETIINLIPVRLLSLVVVSYTSAAVMLTVFGVIGNQVTSAWYIIKLIIFVGMFANIGAGTADLLK